jgi:hypothetical protein
VNCLITLPNVHHLPLPWAKPMGSSVIAKVCPLSLNEALNAMTFAQGCGSQITKKEL